MKQSHSATAWVRGDGTGWYPDCPKCHFYKNSAPGRPCRRSGCDGTIVKVEFQIVKEEACCEASKGR